MERAVLDTDTFSYVTGQRHPAVTAAARQYERVFRYFTITTITVSEVLAGYRHVQDFAAIAEFQRRLEGLEVLPLEEDEAITAGHILGDLRRTGNLIGPLDPFIAAIALENNLPLVTNNTKDYQRIIDLGYPLTLLNWRLP